MPILRVNLILQHLKVYQVITIMDIVIAVVFSRRLEIDTHVHNTKLQLITVEISSAYGSC